jgi:type IV pilus assembly protein PilF
MTRMVLTLLLSLFVSACTTTDTNNDSNADSASAELVQRHLDLAVGYLRNRDYQRAKEKLAKALDIDPKNADVHATYGTVFQLEGELELAEEYFKQAVRYDSNSAQIRNSYGAFLFSEKRFQEAVEQLSKASEDRFYSCNPAEPPATSSTDRNVRDPV